MSTGTIRSHTQMHFEVDMRVQQSTTGLHSGCLDGPRTRQSVQVSLGADRLGLRTPLMSRGQTALRGSLLPLLVPLSHHPDHWVRVLIHTLECELHEDRGLVSLLVPAVLALPPWYLTNHGPRIISTRLDLSTACLPRM